MAEPAAREMTGAKSSAESESLRKLPPVGDVVGIPVGGDDRFPSGFARVFPRLLGKEPAVAAQHVRGQDFCVVPDLFAGDKIVFVDEFAVVLALRANFDAVGGRPVLVAFVDGPDGVLDGLVPLGNEGGALFGSELFLGFQPGAQGGLARLNGGNGFACGPDHDGVLARNVDYRLDFFFFI